MQKQNLTQASKELFRRTPDERYANLDDLWHHCQELKDRSTDRWHPPAEIRVQAHAGRLDLTLGRGEVEGYRLNDWSFSQLCKLANVSRDTVNKVSAETAGRVFAETLPQGGKPMQVLTADRVVRSVHGASYTRLHNLDLLAIVKEFATDFQPPQAGMNGATGLYCGEQDMFVFLIDPTGWIEIEGEAFAPGLFLWNSEVGRRSIGLQTFFFQAVCQNHILWDCVEVVSFTRKHTANVVESLSEIRRIIARLVEKRDERRDGFARVMKNAFQMRLGDKAEDVAKVLFKHGIPRDLAKRALALAEKQGRFTLFSLVDALTRVAGEFDNAGDRLEADEKAGALLALAGEHASPKSRALLAAV